MSVSPQASSSVSPSARQTVSVILNGSSVRDHSHRDGWRNTDDGGRDSLRLDSAISGMPQSMRLRPCPPHDTEDKMSAQTEERDRQARWAGFLRGAVFSMRFEPRGKGGVVASRKVICQGLLRSGDIHHIVCEKHCLVPRFFFLSLLSAVSLNRGSVCTSPSVY